MPDAISASALLRDAATYFDAEHNGLAHAARTAAKRGFASGGEWMRQALRTIRADSLAERRINFHFLGLVKYGLATTAATGIVAVAIWRHWYWFLPFAFIVFYAIEAQMVFLFPLAIDGSRDLISESRRWTRQAGGTGKVMKTVLHLASAMLSGGLIGRGFLRSWCLGCLAVLIWYERLRTDRSVRSVWRSGLEIAACRSLRVRRESFRLLNLAQPLRVLYASDLHLRGSISRRVSRQLIEAARECAPDLILLGGDLVDCKRGLMLLSGAVRELSRIAPVWAVPGNHDVRAGLAEVQAAVEQGGGIWLANRSMSLDKNGALSQPLVVDGTPRNVPAIQPTILCAHNPEIFAEAVRRGYSLVLAGHLHGCQFVTGERDGKFLPGGWFYQWNGLRFNEGSCTMLVSRGVSDTFPLRWNCSREILLCEIY